ncbi:helix-turn-helix transcriptional regulator [Catellatospora sp. NPDC049133]|uniref:helix-turn-helix domain-containing protein n=1 Tax=Catellatospora sp. NPDC049133 TaxID=3155499 RepID=UPI0033D3EA28
MASADAPVVARRRLRIVLRGLREAADLTQGDVATALDWSLSKVQRIESGEVTISSTDLRALLDKLDVTDQERVAQLVSDAKVARRRVAGWWDEPGFRSHLTPGTAQLMQFESQATTIRMFASIIIPGVLQTRRHADAVLAFWHSDVNALTDQQRAARLEVRLRRHRHVFERPDPPAYLLTIDESALYRVSGAEVAVEQLQHLLNHIVTGKLSLRILPVGPTGAATLGPFTLLELDTEGDAVLYRESWSVDEVVDDPAEVAQHRRIFDELTRRSYSAERSTRVLEARIAAVRAEIDN